MATKKKKSGKSPATSVKADRNYLLSSEQIEKLREEWKAAGAKKKTPPNPHRAGNYHYLCASLITLGVNHPHPFTAVKRELKRLMSLAETRRGEGAAAQSAWERFAGKQARNEETGKDVDGRIRQNIEVLQRTADYGAKLIQVGKEILGTKGMTIDTLPDDMIRLSTDSDTPERQLRRSRKEEPAKGATKAAKAKPPTKKPAKAKAVKATPTNGKKSTARPKKAAKDGGEVAAQPLPENSDLGQATATADPIEA